MGDQAFHPGGAPPGWRNAGAEPASLLEARLTTVRTSVPPQGSIRYPLVAASPFTPRRPRSVRRPAPDLALGDTFTAEAAPGLALLSIASGQMMAHDALPRPGLAQARPRQRPAF
ncbi:MAG: hypothetical protein R2853_09720 [Thermomicrobiales bacterium]